MNLEEVCCRVLNHWRTMNHTCVLALGTPGDDSMVHLSLYWVERLRTIQDALFQLDYISLEDLCRTMSTTSRDEALDFRHTIQPPLRADAAKHL